MMGEIERNTLATALKGEDSDVQDKIFRNRSQEDIEFMGAVSRSDVYKAQREIIAVFRRLEASGAIYFDKIYERIF